VKALSRDGLGVCPRMKSGYLSTPEVNVRLIEFFFDFRFVGKTGRLAPVEKDGVFRPLGVLDDFGRHFLALPAGNHVIVGDDQDSRL
jgi:hypothetical protein